MWGSSVFVHFLLLLLIVPSVLTRDKAKNKYSTRPEPWSSIAYVPGLDGFPCEKDAWIPDTEEYPILQANQGKIKGHHRCKVNRRYANPDITDGMGPKQFEGDSFYNVPYAKHSRRFDYGIYPHPKWDDTLSGTSVNKRFNCFPVTWYNIGTNGREDCLNMHLHIPGSLAQAVAADEKLPVLLFLHGGDYSYGSADGGGTFDSYWYDGLIMGSYGNYIFASINYRMHSFGFLSTEDENARGNYAVDDVINAIQWVWDNADAIGADPTKITLMGQSSGAALAHDVAITPQMKGKLFNVIPLSGSAVSYWGYWNHTQSIRNARELASGAHCNYPDTSELVECLRQLPPEELTILRLHRNDTWRPAVEDRYFPGTAEELVEENHDFNLFISSLPDDGYEYIFTEGEITDFEVRVYFIFHLKLIIFSYRILDTVNFSSFSEAY